jgi:hypothetical protein
MSSTTSSAVPLIGAGNDAHIGHHMLNTGVTLCRALQLSANLKFGSNWFDTLAKSLDKSDPWWNAGR